MSIDISFVLLLAHIISSQMTLNYLEFILILGGHVISTYMYVFIWSP